MQPARRPRVRGPRLGLRRRLARLGLPWRLLRLLGGRRRLCRCTLLWRLGPCRLRRWWALRLARALLGLLLLLVRLLGLLAHTKIVTLLSPSRWHMYQRYAHICSAIPCSGSSLLSLLLLLYAILLQSTARRHVRIAHVGMLLP